MDHSFCRVLLLEVMKDVRKVTSIEERKLGVAWRCYGQHVEFYGPNDFHYPLKACCLWSAKAEGWEKWMNEHCDFTKEGKLIGRKDAVKIK